MEKVVIATTNQNKIVQMREALSDLADNYEFVSLSDVNFTKDIVETGETLEANSLLKAQTVCNEVKLPCLSDDSGFFIEAMNNEPGIKAGRFLKSFPDPKKLNCLSYIIDKMKDVENKNCYYQCVLTLVFPDGRKIVASGKCEGTIDSKITNLETGFDYDCIFIEKTKNKVLSAMNEEELLEVNHRGKACADLVRQLSV